MISEPIVMEDLCSGGNSSSNNHSIEMLPVKHSISAMITLPLICKTVPVLITFCIILVSVLQCQVVNNSIKMRSY